MLILQKFSIRHLKYLWKSLHVHTIFHCYLKLVDIDGSLLLFFQLDKLEQETLKWCREILRNSPTSIRVLKSALNAADESNAGLQVNPCH